MSETTAEKRFVAPARVKTHRSGGRKQIKSQDKPVTMFHWTSAGLIMLAVYFCSVLPTESATAKLFLASAILFPVAIVVTLRSTLFSKTSPIVITAFHITLLLVGWGYLQSVDLPGWMYELLAPGSVVARTSLIDASIDAISQSTAALDAPLEFMGSKTSVALVPDQSSRSLFKYSIAFVTFFLSATVFQTRKMRRSFLWTIALTSTLFVFWGLVQRGTGSNNLLPFVANPLGTTKPFGPFIYKNAGAAAIVPGIAAILGLFVAFLPERFRIRSRSIKKSDPERLMLPNHRHAGGDGAKHAIPQSLTSKPRSREGFMNGYVRAHWLADRKRIALLGLLAFLVCGVLASLSRGAVLATITTLTIVALLPPLNRLLHRLAFVAAITVVVGVVISGLTNLTKILDQRSGQWQYDALTADMRWQHWATCAKTIGAYFPMGTGLGAYGYAALQQQVEPSRLWFRQAHNQYLETIAELGLPGLILMLWLIYLMSHTCVRLLRGHSTSEMASLGIAGSTLLIATIIQNLFDFVIMVPGVLLINAAFWGVIAAAATESQKKTHHPSSPTESDPATQVGESKSVLGVLEQLTSNRKISVVVTLLLVLSLWHHFRQHQAGRVLNATSLSRIATYAPTHDEVNDAISLLDSVIDSGQRNNEVYRRRAMWHLASYRLEILDAASQAGLDLPWSATAPEQLFRATTHVDPDERARRSADFLETDAMRKALSATLSDLGRSIVANPFIPQSHLVCACLSPISGMPWELFSSQCQQLSQSNPDLMFVNGLMGYLSGDTDMMLNQWSRSLRVSNNNLKPIVELAQSALTPEQFADELFPKYRVDLLTTTIRYKGRPFTAKINLDITPELVASAVTRIQNAPHLTEFERHSTIAQIYAASQLWDDASQHWLESVHLDGRNVESRYQLAFALNQTGKYEEALQHCETGTLLNPYDGRLRTLKKDLLRLQRSTQ